MRHGDRIAGFEGLHRFGTTKNYHIADKNGRAYFCGCFKSIWVIDARVNRHRKSPSSMKMLKGSMKVHTEHWHRKHTFRRNLERIADMRILRERRKAELLSVVAESKYWDDWKWNAVGDMWLLDEACDWLERMKRENNN